MAQALQPLTPANPDLGRAKKPDLLRFVPALTLLSFLVPVLAGLVGTWLPAFGHLPALDRQGPGLDPWHRLFADPALPGALRLTLVSGLLATALSLLLVIGFLATCHGRRIHRHIERLLTPLLSLPHAALAIGLAFLIAPSGWISRLLSPWATGWDRPPDMASVQDPNGLALAFGLLLKETPFLLLMTLAALHQGQAERRLAVARSLGYGPAEAWIKTVLPAIYGQIRLPIYAVLAYALSVVDMAIILAPATPPTLAVLVFRWFNDPDLTMRFTAAAGATLQLAIIVAAIALWYGAERAVAAMARPWLTRGWPRAWPRGWQARHGAAPRLVAAGAMVTVFLFSGASLLVMLIWSLARRWRYPEAWPGGLSLDTWMRQGGELWWSASTTLFLGLASAGLALALALGCLENERRHGVTLTAKGLWLLYAPLLVPQVAFLFGCQVLAIQFGIEGTWIALIWSHLLFVLPYVFLTLADPFRSLDDRYERTALCLGASRNRIFWRIKLPMLLRPILIAFAVGFAVSVAQFLPTLFAGGGRFATLTTEAVSLAGGADRRVIGVYALLQGVTPLIAFAAALFIPAWLFRDRRALRSP